MTISASATANPLLATLLDAVAKLMGAGGLAGAQQAFAAYHASAGDQLISIAQIVGFAMVSLDSLGLSMSETLPEPMKLKLRSNANGLARTAVNATKILETQRQTAEFNAEHPEAEPREAEPDMLHQNTPPPDREPSPKPPAAGPASAEQQRDRSWANAMTDVAAELTAELPGLSAAQRHLQHRRISALKQTASALNSGKAPPLRARLLSTASLLTSKPPPRT